MLLSSILFLAELLDAVESELNIRNEIESKKLEIMRGERMAYEADIERWRIEEEKAAKKAGNKEKALAPKKTKKSKVKASKAIPKVVNEFTMVNVDEHYAEIEDSQYLLRHEAISIESIGLTQNEVSRTYLLSS